MLMINSEGAKKPRGDASCYLWKHRLLTDSETVQHINATYLCILLLYSAPHFFDAIFGGAELASCYFSVSGCRASGEPTPSHKRYNSSSTYLADVTLSMSVKGNGL